MRSQNQRAEGRFPRWLFHTQQSRPLLAISLPKEGVGFLAIMKAYNGVAVKTNHTDDVEVSKTDALNMIHIS